MKEQDDPAVPRVKFAIREQIRSLYRPGHWFTFRERLARIPDEKSRRWLRPKIVMGSICFVLLNVCLAAGMYKTAALYVFCVLAYAADAWSKVRALGSPTEEEIASLGLADDED